MVRSYKRKTNRVSTPRNIIVLAMKQVKFEGCTMRHAAAEFGIPLSSLSRYCAQMNIKSQKEIPENEITIGYCRPRAVFSMVQESNLAQHVKKSLRVQSRLSSLKIRRLAYEYATALGLNLPTNWKKDYMAGRDWLMGFLKRHGLKTISNLGNDTSTNADELTLIFNDLSYIEQVDVDLEDIELAESLMQDEMIENIKIDELLSQFIC
ncbi:hypothetical protein TKK_0007856 [Trichogramma kaykai]|uniref:HTH psq-type domain-containing protein n=1 Tax=Trichogramma kaykai TaxID=54128 RepID=A0ABD2X7F3_9HYME